MTTEQIKNCAAPNVWKFLFKYAYQAKNLVVSLFLIFVVMSFCRRLESFIMAEMVGVLSAASEYAHLALTLGKYLCAFAAAMLVRTAGEFGQRTLEAYFVPFFNSRISKDLFVMVHKHSPHFFEEEMAGNISGKANNISRNVEHMYYSILYGVTVPLMEIGMSLAFIAFIDIKLMLILGAINLFFMALTIYFRRQITSFAMMRSKLNSEANGIFVDGVTNSGLVKSFANYFHEKLKFFQAVRKASRAEKQELLKIARINWYSKSIFDVLTIVSYALIFYFWYRYHLTVANVVLALTLVGTFVEAIRQMGWVASNFAQVFGSIQDGLNLLSVPCEVVDKPNAKKLKVRNNTVEYAQIDFSYKDTKKLFNGFNLKVEANQKVGLVGRSGSGKSSLIKLLLRYYDLQGGQILIDGKNIADMTQDSLRKNIAIIPQESTLFNRTIMENIRYGNPKATDRQVIAAAKKAYIHDFIMTLPDGYDSKVGERGIMLSGGERQRIAIARAILKNAPILILDEATSALDSESERYIQKSLQGLMKNKTVIAIAHRLSTLNEMDRLVVIEKGKIIEDGAHAELMALRGAYYQFYNMQAAGMLNN